MKTKLIMAASLVCSLSAFAQDTQTLLKCIGQDGNTKIEVSISKSKVNSKPASSLEGYFTTTLKMDNKQVYSSDYTVYNSRNDEFFVSGSSALMIQRVSNETSYLYLNVTNAFGAPLLPVYNTLPVVCYEGQL